MGGAGAGLDECTVAVDAGTDDGTAGDGGTTDVTTDGAEAWTRLLEITHRRKRERERRKREREREREREKIERERERNSLQTIPLHG